jgi:hypothetical protein
MSEKEAAARLLSGRAWDDFLDVLRIAGHTVDRWGDEIGDLERAEWYRFMTRVVRNGCERFMENCEPYRPRLRDAPWKSSINFQSPDQDHFLCEFDEPGDYRITGGRGTIPYFVIAAWSAAQPKDIGARDWAPRGFDGLKEFDPATLKTGAFVQSDTLEFKPDGTFELIVSQQPHPGNWLKLEPDSVGLLIRTVYHRRVEEQAPEFRIERLDRARPRPAQPAEVASNLAKAAQEVLGYAELVRSWWQDNLSKRPNRLRFSRATYLSNGGVPDRHFAFGTWSIKQGEALALQFKPPECEYWIFQLCNVWQENLDNYEDGQGYVTKFTARYEPDGAVRVVIAERDPGIGGNWIDPFGHKLGGMGLRLIKTDQPPPVTAHLIPLEELARKGWNCLDPARAIMSGEIVP